MSDLSVFLPKILQYAPGCAEPAAEDAIRSAAIEFCERTRLWRDTITATTAAFGPIAIEPPEDAIVHDIEVAFADGREIEPLTTFELDDRYSNWRTDDCVGQAQYVTQLSEDEISIVPWAACDVSIRVRLKPTQESATLPDFLAARYRDTIQAGALARLLLLPGQPFMNINLAGAFGQKFQADLDRLSGKQTTGQQRAPARTKARFF